MWFFFAWLTAALTAPVTQPVAQGAPAMPDPPVVQDVQVRSVAEVDLERYSGRWYEVARLPNRFQEDCVSGTTADYERLDNGDVRVVNRCIEADGSTVRAEGRARPRDRSGPTSQLEVRFAPRFLSFLPMVWGDYWILDLTDDYDAALVGEPEREYLWILSRTPELDAPTRERMLRTASAQGFDISRLIWSQ